MRLPWFQSRNERRFRTELLPHADALYGFALKLSKNPTDAEDLVQETLLKGLAAVERIPESSHYKGWLFTILRNTWLSRMRREGRIEYSAEPPDMPSPVREDRPHLDTDGSGPGGAGLERLSRHVFSDVVHHALLRLPEPQRTAVVLCDIEEMPYDEIARVLDCPIGTVRSRIFHARRALRDALMAHACREGVVRHGTAAMSKG